MSKLKIKAYIYSIMADNYKIFDAEPYACLQRILDLLDEMKD